MLDEPLESTPDEPVLETDDIHATLNALSGRDFVSVADAARGALEAPGVYPVAGAEGTGPALLSRALLKAGARHVLYVTADTESALRAADDIEGLAALGFDGDDGTTPLVLPSTETSPYAEVHGD